MFFDNAVLAAVAVNDVPSGGRKGGDVSAKHDEFGEEVVPPLLRRLVIRGVELHALVHEAHHGVNQLVGFVHDSWMVARAGASGRGGGGGG